MQGSTARKWVAILVTAALALGGSENALAQTNTLPGASQCSSIFGFAAEPVPVAKTPDGRTVLATAEWGHSPQHDLCYLILDSAAVDALRNAPPTNNPQRPAAQDTTAAAICHDAHNPNSSFAAEPVPVAKTPDGRTVLATVEWGHSPQHDLCYLVLDDVAQQTLQGAHRHALEQEPTTPFDSVAHTAIVAGRYHWCALATDQTIECWGSNRAGQAYPPDGPHIAIAAGGAHSCGLTPNRAIECWGNNDFGQANAPDGPHTAIAAGQGHSCGIGADQSVRCWGNSDFGQAHPPEGRFTTVAAGDAHSCGITVSGAVQCWGNDELGQANPPAGRFTAVAAGWGHSCGLRANGTIKCWGNNGSRQANAPEGQFTYVTAGDVHTCGLRANGTVECWGVFGFFGQGSFAPEGQFTAVAAGGGYSCGLRVGGAIECWGRLDLIETDHPGPGTSPNHTPTTPRSTRAVTVEMPLRVYVAGDSQTPFLGSWLGSDNRLDLTVDARHSTGLARPDVYDWTSRFADVLAHQDPEFVVLVIGGNDPQAMWNADGTTAAPYLGSGWRREYTRRLNSVLDQFAASHRHLVWVGQPPARPHHFHEGYAVLNQIAAEVIADRTDTTFLDIWDLFGGERPYQADIAPPGGGELVTVRHSDGVHLNLTGSRWVAELVLDVAFAQWDFMQ